VLLAVLIVLVVLTLAAYEFSELMTAEHKAAYSYLHYIQARAMAESGIQYAAATLSNTDTYQNTLGSNPWNNPQAFQNVVVPSPDESAGQGMFSLIAPLGPDMTASSEQSFNYGVTDEGGKINLNAVMRVDSSGQMLFNMLMTLPNMTEDVANSILDWLDTDDEPRTDGAEGSYYGGLNPPYQAKNGPLNTLEELLLVKGVTPQLLFGNDLNRNGLLDPGENDGSGAYNSGWSAYLTVSSRERNIDSSGAPRIFLNDSNLDNLYTNLSTAVGADMANYILAYRIYGPTSTTPTSGSGTQGGSGTKSNTASSNTPSSQSGSNPSNAQAGKSGGSGSSGGGGSNSGSNPRLSRAGIGSFSQGGSRHTISSVYQLIKSTVSIPASATSTAAGNSGATTTNSGSSSSRNSTAGTSRSGSPATSNAASGNNGSNNSSTPQATVYPSPLNDSSQLQQLLPLLLDKTTTVNAAELPPRVNVNTASSTVLQALPGLSDTDVQAVMQNRPDPSSGDVSDATFQTPAWLMLKANISANKMQTLDKYITASTQVYRVQALGYFKGGGPTARIEAIIDTNAGRPRIIYWRDLTELGKAYDLNNQ
jgi:type II secretory pathway component PulK